MVDHSNNVEQKETTYKKQTYKIKPLRCVQRLMSEVFRQKFLLINTFKNQRIFFRYDGFNLGIAESFGVLYEIS